MRSLYIRPALFLHYAVIKFWFRHRDQRKPGSKTARFASKQVNDRKVAQGCHVVVLRHHVFLAKCRNLGICLIFFVMYRIWTIFARLFFGKLSAEKRCSCPFCCHTKVSVNWNKNSINCNPENRTGVQPPHEFTEPCCVSHSSVFWPSQWSVKFGFSFNYTCFQLSTIVSKPMFAS